VIKKYREEKQRRIRF